ncbi:GTP cyclohydrolase I FolE [candidate division WWE3 bacterium]|uniref:GTP cyclohydrolase 1 n=1 Tax=candidate division WWE3 bacterium TaxID=2053526 RepID=A0A3A4ZM94_UNCKA|nr:MAG: GTP cyclohydrolase I FolE [candidate division WWE3 bacterium]
MNKITRQISIIRNLISLIGDNPDREGLRETPRRVLRSYSELFSGYMYSDIQIRRVLQKTFTETHDYDEIIVCKNIPFMSFCEHHILPFQGVCHIGYLPNKVVVGLSKLPRLVDIYSKRLQIQERMTMEIASMIFSTLKSRGVGVIIEAEHLCVACRGVKKVGSRMVTSAMLGLFREQAETRQEFLELTR